MKQAYTPHHLRKVKMIFARLRWGTQVDTRSDIDECGGTVGVVVLELAVVPRVDSVAQRVVLGASTVIEILAEASVGTVGVEVSFEQWLPSLVWVLRNSLVVHAGWACRGGGLGKAGDGVVPHEGANRVVCAMDVEPNEYDVAVRFSVAVTNLAFHWYCCY